MIQSVQAIILFQDEVYIIERQDHLSVFPGYYGFPGGKLEHNDGEMIPDSFFPNVKHRDFLGALHRELREEVNFDLLDWKGKGCLKRVQEIGYSVTPDVHLMRFFNRYYLIETTVRPEFQCHESEIKRGFWEKPKNILEEFEKGDFLCVPPFRRILSELLSDTLLGSEKNFSITIDPSIEHMVVESLKGIEQIFVPSLTLPPAVFTNAFLIDSILVDPSPMNEKEYQKLISTLAFKRPRLILITHHHSDHHQLAPCLAQYFDIPLLMSEKTRDRILDKHGIHYFAHAPIRILQEKEVIGSWLGQNLIVTGVPGHDDGQMALYPESLSWFLVGDLIQHTGSVVIGTPEGHMDQYFETLQRVIKLQPRHILPSHGMITKGVFLLEKTLKHRKMRELQIKELWEQGHNIENIINILYNDVDQILHRYARKNIVAHLKHLGFDSKEIGDL